MKLILSCILLIFATTQSYTQETIIKLAPAFSLRLENKITNNSSWQMGAGYTSYSFFGRTTIRTFSGGIRFYTRENMQGFYAYPLITLANVDSESTTLFGAIPTLTNEDFVSYGIVIGRQWITDNGLTIDVGLGIAKGQQTNKVDAVNPEFSFYNGVHPKFAFAFGYAWMD